MLSSREFYLRQVQLTASLTSSSYLNHIPAIRHLMHQPLAFTQPVTFLVGENGAGKSTLIEGIAAACGFNPEGGTRNLRFSTHTTHSELWNHLTLVRSPHQPRDGFFLRAESFYNVATSIDQLDAEYGFGPPLIDRYGGVSLHEQSHGESFLALVHNRLEGNGLYILDEPEAALSPMRLMALIVEIDRLVQSNSQLIIATHSPMLMTYPNAQILLIDETGIHPTDWRDTPHVQITRRFLENPSRMLHELLDD